MESSAKWWRRRPATPVAVLVAVAVVLALVGATLGVTALVRLPARGTTCDARTAAAEVFPSLVAVGAPGDAHRTTGIVVRGNGVILAVSAGLSTGGSVPLTLSDGETASASVLGVDAASGLALLQVDRKQMPFLLPSPHEPLPVGLPVTALGSPHADGSAVLSGTVQGVGANVEISAQPSWRLAAAVTTDLPSTDANAGAPILTCDNRMVGIIVGRIADGTSVAVSAEAAHRVITRLLGLG